MKHNISNPLLLFFLLIYSNLFSQSDKTVSPINGNINLFTMTNHVGIVNNFGFFRYNVFQFLFYPQNLTLVKETDVFPAQFSGTNISILSPTYTCHTQIVRPQAGLAFFGINLISLGDSPADAIVIESIVDQQPPIMTIQNGSTNQVNTYYLSSSILQNDISHLDNNQLTQILLPIVFDNDVLFLQ